MKIEEAIKHAKEQKVIFGGTHKEFLEMAIESLEKQVPKKAKDVRHFRKAGYYVGICPCCNDVNNSGYKYCGNCGQKLDWSEEE